MEETVTSRLSKEDIELLNKFVEMGYFTSRSEAIRSLISKGLKDLIDKQLKQGLLEELDTEPMLSEEELLEYGKILFKGSVAEIISQGRER